MNLRQSYHFINTRLRVSYRESSMRWGFRVAISITMPLLWGLLTNHRVEAEWMSIAAECVSLFELKGNIGQRIRMLVMASLFSVSFCLLGSLAGNIPWLMLLGMLLVGFFCVLLKNLGDRGTGLALSVYIFYIIACAYPVREAHVLWDRCFWVGMGSLWTIVVGLVTFLFIRTGTPYRSTIASIWNAMAQLAAGAAQGWDGKSVRLSERDLYLREKEVRTCLDDSLYLFENVSDALTPSQGTEYILAQSRKSAALVSMYVIQIAESVGTIFNQRERHISLQVFSLFRALQQIGERMSEYLIGLKTEERVLLLSRLERLQKIVAVLRQSSETKVPQVREVVEKIYLYAGRVDKMVRHSLNLLDNTLGEKRVIQSYSFAQTLQILHPRYLRSNLKQLVNYNSMTTRYAFRIGLSLMLAALLAVMFFKNHGYWITFTTIIVAQPYFGATLKKGLQRSLGTISGIVIGTAFLQIPFPVVSKVVLVFVSSVGLVYYLRKNYAVAAFFITLMLVGILSLEPDAGKTLTGLMTLRLSGTLIGSAIAIAAGFLLLPTWDKDMFPRYRYDAFLANYHYFINTFYSNFQEPWLRHKRLAETLNANAFDSLSRYVKEPGRRHLPENEQFFYWMTHNVRITRELNNFNSEAELDDFPVPISEKEKYMQLLSACDDLFREITKKMAKRLPTKIENGTAAPETYPLNGFITQTPTNTQMISVEKLWMELKFIHEGLHSEQQEAPVE
ncbi:MAG TPA: FUSC family protein [Edaphocola sp.]|nr:FUSC family protein [Edaphocola sp.]